MESLPETVVAQITQHLTLKEICSFGLVSTKLNRSCRSQEVWEAKFHSRFHYGKDSIVLRDYYQGYKEAYANIHDLWVFHQNIVYPSDGYVPGRCCVWDDEEEKKVESSLAESSYLQDSCFSQRMDGRSPFRKKLVRPQLSSKEAFRRAGTMHREPRTDQYNPNKFCFLTDALFFNLTDPMTSEGQWELNHPQTLSDTHEVALHSVHVLRLHNPTRETLVYQFASHDQFTAYPSEGWLLSGESVNVHLSVRSLGSRIAYATHALNVHRDSIDVEWSDLYKEHAHLPLAPYLLRYTVASVEMNKLINQSFLDQRVNLPHKKQLLEDFWSLPMPSHMLRSIRLSAHVHSFYSFFEFAAFTCRPWKPDEMEGSFWSPNIEEKDIRVLEAMRNCSITNTRGLCAKDPDALRKNVVAPHKQFHQSCKACMSTRSLIYANILLALEVLDESTKVNRNRASELVVSIFNLIQILKASPLLNADSDDFSTILQLEAEIDVQTERIPVGGESWIQWKHYGSFRVPNATDYEHQQSSSVSFKQTFNFREEPEYLVHFRKLVHNGGLFCLGKQLDPNHDEEEISDLFLSDAASSLQAAICMVRDPRPLLVHGFYTRIRYPGIVPRRPKLLFFSASEETEQLPTNMIIKSFQNRTKFLLPSVMEVGSFQCSFSLYSFLNDVPVPGTGPMLLPFPALSSIEKGQNIGFEDVADDLLSENGISESIPQVPTGRLRRPRHRRGRGPRIFQLLWLMGAQLGLFVIDESVPHSVFIDRRILVPAFCLSLSTAMVPLMISLFVRWAGLLPSSPVTCFDAPPFLDLNRMQYLNQRECLQIAVILFFLWIGVLRWLERNTSRNYFRSIIDFRPPGEKTFFQRCRIAFEGRLDLFLPLFLQKRIFNTGWNRKTKKRSHKHISFVRNYFAELSERLEDGRSSQISELQSSALAKRGTATILLKVSIGIILLIGGFAGSSAHYWVNFMSIIPSSIALGMSVSVHELEEGETALPLGDSWSFLKSINLATVSIFSILLGQLTGSSGGTLFLLEVLVAMLGMLIGGAGTMSASAIESWGCFLSLSISSFWGYLLGRIALMDGIRMKRPGYSSVFLSYAMCFCCVFWCVVWFVAKWETVTSELLERVHLTFPHENLILYLQ